ncbi:hypothetical protein G9A89_021690 [Geosiphon pyriformis]|nr:hypothetical protein G9A89_021690 [Geosiphon pyriformis]
MKGKRHLMNYVKLALRGISKPHFGETGSDSEIIWVTSRSIFHFCRMSDHIGDDIHLHGIALRNLKIQHDFDVHEGLIDIGPLPAHVADVPLLQDHHLGLYINNLAKAAGCMVEELPYKHLHILAEDTGEEFLSDYFHSQMKRNGNNLTMPNPANYLCGCCAMHGSVLPVLPDGAVHEPTPLSPTVVIATDREPVQLMVLPIPGQEETSKFCCSSGKGIGTKAELAQGRQLSQLCHQRPHDGISIDCEITRAGLPSKTYMGFTPCDSQWKTKYMS